MASEAASAAQAVAPAEQGHRRPYVYVFVALAVVTLIEVYISTLSFAYTDRVLLLVTLATFKASLVVAYYMHLKYEPRWIMLIPFGGLALVFILVAALLSAAGQAPLP